MRSAQPTWVETTPLAVQFTGEFSSLPGVKVSPWNHTWLKTTAIAVAETDSAGEHLAPAAVWTVGQGRALAAGFGLSSDALAGLTKAIERPPVDPRFRVTWETGPNLHVSIDAVATTAAETRHRRSFRSEQLPQRSMLTLELSSAEPGVTAPVEFIPILQSAPGRYDLTIPATRLPTFATVRMTDEAGTAHTLDRFAAAGRYVPEFEAIGNDFRNLQALAEKTGGAIVSPQQVTPIDFKWPSRDVPLGSWLASSGAFFIALGFILWRAL